MARSVLNKAITSVASYTVPAGKMAVFKAFPATGEGRRPVIIGGVTVANVQMLSEAADSPTVQAGPLTADAGDVISTTGSGTVGLSGFLYDK